MSFFEFTCQIENDAGRVRSPDGLLPRTLDIDIVLFGDTRCANEKLVIPHPRATRRRFVMQPLADIRPNLKFPGDDKTVKEHLAEIPSKPRVMIEDNDQLSVKELAKWNYPF